MTFEEILVSLIPSSKEDWVEIVLTKERNHEWNSEKKKKFVREANRIQKENTYRYEPNSIRNITLGLLVLYQESEGNLEEIESILLAELTSSFEEGCSSMIIQTWNDQELLSLVLDQFGRNKEKASQFLHFLERELQRGQERKDPSYQGEKFRDSLKNFLQTADPKALEDWSNQQLEQDVMESLDRQLMGGK